MKRTAPKSISLSRLANDWFNPGYLQKPGGVGLAAAGHVALVVNANPETVPALWEMALFNPIASVALLVTVAGLGFLASRLSEAGRLLIRRITIGSIAICLVVIAGDMLNVLKADLQPWTFIVVVSTALVLFGGLTSLIVEARARLDR